MGAAQARVDSLRARQRGQGKRRRRLNRPVFTIIAGSNGCGKSTLTSTARDKFQQTPVLDPDAIAKSLQATMDSGNSNPTRGFCAALRS